jgi:hypothetical protein
MLKALATVVENEADEDLASSAGGLVGGRGLEVLLVLSSWLRLMENDLGMFIVGFIRKTIVQSGS